jgi:hypothetical protein
MDINDVCKVFAAGMLALGGLSLVSIVRCETAAMKFRHAQLGYESARAKYDTAIGSWEDFLAESDHIISTCEEQLEAAGLEPPWGIPDEPDPDSEERPPLPDVPASL